MIVLCLVGHYKFISVQTHLFLFSGSLVLKSGHAHFALQAAAPKMTRCAWANQFVAGTAQLGGQPEILGPSGFNLNSQNFEPRYDYHNVKSSHVSIARHSF